jgi:hypothetical protein
MTMIKFRPQRGSLIKAMDQCVRCHPTRDAIAKAAARIYKTGIDPTSIELQDYGYDERIGWHTWVVVGRFCACDSRCVIGFTNGPIEDGVRCSI